MSNLIIFDYECTHLDPRKGHLLELAGIAIDTKTMTEIESFQQIIVPEDRNWARTMNDYVLNMHTENGLLQSIAEAQCGVDQYDDSDNNPFDLHEVESEAISFVQEHTDKNKRGKRLPPVWGGYNPQFDRKWAEMYMPKLDSNMHYRSCDVNAFWMMKNWAIGDQPFVKRGNHRALSDCRDTLDTLAEFVKVYQAGHRALNPHED